LISEDDLRRERLESHLDRLMQAATRDDHAGARLEEMPPSIEGRVDTDSVGERTMPTAVISDQLDMDRAEAAVLHEAGHWLNGDEEFMSERWRGYVAARLHDEEHGTRTRGPFELEADRTALGRLDDPTVRQVLETDPTRVRELLIEDAEQYGGRDSQG
jgi:hypothetical protein